MTQLDEETLMAYVDRQLDSQHMAEVEAALLHDPEARATVRMFQHSAATLRGAFDSILREPVPNRLLAALNSPPTGNNVQDIRLARRGGAARGLTQTVWARAAAVALLVGASAGYLSAQWGQTPSSESAARIAATDPLLNEALETTASGAVFARQEREGGVGRDILPLLTFRDAENRYCREFESTLKGVDKPRVNYGVACREEGVWQPRAVMAGSLIAPTLGGEPTEHSEYVPAMGGDVAGFDTVIQQLMVDQPLKPDEEAAVIGRGWR